MKFKPILLNRHITWYKIDENRNMSKITRAGKKNRNRDNNRNGYPHF